MLPVGLKVEPLALIIPAGVKLKSLSVEPLAVAASAIAAVWPVTSLNFGVAPSD